VDTGWVTATSCKISNGKPYAINFSIIRRDAVRWILGLFKDLELQKGKEFYTRNYVKTLRLTESGRDSS